MPTGCTGGSLYATRIKTGHQVRFRLISHSTSTPLYFTIDNHSLMIIEIDGVEIEPIATTRVFLNPGQRYSVLVAANQTAGNYMMRTAAATGCFHLAHAPDGISGLASIQYEATGILSYDDTEISAKLIGSSWELGDMSNPSFGNEPWQYACRDLPFNIPRPMEKKKAYDVGERNHHYLSFHQEMIGDVYRTYVNKVANFSLHFGGFLTDSWQTIFAPLQDDATLWKVLQRGMESKDIHFKGLEWDFGPNQQVLVSQDVDKAAQIVINSETMMIHPWHLQ